MCRAAHGVWNQALSLAHTTSHSGRMEAPRPSAGPFIATTMGFLKWMNADTNSLKWPNQVTDSNLVTIGGEKPRGSWSRCRHGAQIDSLPYGVGDAAALLPAVGGQAADQVRRLQAIAENRPHRAEQQQLAVVGGCVGQSSAQFLHDLRRTVQEVHHSAALMMESSSNLSSL